MNGFVSIPRDLTKVKSKLIFNMTRRQLICFGTAAAIGAPMYFLTRGAIGNSAAVLVMIGIMLPLFFIAMYEKDGMPAEKVMRNYVRARIYWAGVRPYRSENFYEIIEREGKIIAVKNEAAAGAAVTQRKPGKGKPRRYAKVSAKK